MFSRFKYAITVRSVLAVPSFGSESVLAANPATERTYHRRRRKRSLVRMTPVELEAVFQALDEVDVAA
jgi:hypothetical protein